MVRLSSLLGSQRTYHNGMKLAFGGDSEGEQYVIPEHRSMHAVNLDFRCRIRHPLGRLLSRCYCSFSFLFFS